MNAALTSLHTVAIIAMVHQMIVICGMVALGIALFSFIRNASDYMRTMAYAKKIETERRYAHFRTS